MAAERSFEAKRSTHAALAAEDGAPRQRLASRKATGLILPAPLRAGDAVGIIAPSSNIDRPSLEAGCAELRRLGYRPTYAESIFERDRYFAGSTERRARELHEMFADPQVRAILCARGGYGSNYLLPLIDLDLLRRSPKILAGYSDATSLLTYIHDATGLVTFHAPMAAKDFAHPGGIDIASWRAAMEGAEEWRLGPDSGMVGLAQGKAEGKLYGGCLSLIAASLGTPYEVHCDDCILFLEDVAAKPYQIDRMLMQLRLAGKLSQVRGILFGQMLDCRQHPEQPYTLQEVLMSIVGDLGVPVAFGLRSGHVTGANITLAMGVRVQLSVSGDAASLTMLEAAVAPAKQAVHRS